MEYTVDYFIKKFEAIPEEDWCIEIQQNEKGQRCAFGHCLPLGEKRKGVYYEGDGSSTTEGESLSLIFVNANIFYGNDTRLSGVTYVNNGLHKSYQQPTPKQRVLAALYDIKEQNNVDAAKEILTETQFAHELH